VVGGSEKEGTRQWMTHITAAFVLNHLACAPQDGFDFAGVQGLMQDEVHASIQKAAYFLILADASKDHCEPVRAAAANVADQPEGALGARVNEDPVQLAPCHIGQGRGAVGKVMGDAAHRVNCCSQSPVHLCVLTDDEELPCGLVRRWWHALGKVLGWACFLREAFILQLFLTLNTTKIITYGHV